MTAPRRRWFQFSLMTLFVGLGLAAIPMAWLGSQWRIVANRKQAIGVLQRDGAAIEIVNDVRFWAAVNSTTIVTLNLPNWRSRPVDGDTVRTQLEERLRLSRVRQWLGDKPVGRVELPYFYREADRERVQAMFPEAEVLEFRPEAH